MVIKLNDSNFEEEVLKTDKTVLVDMFATWCGPCKMMHPVLEEVKQAIGNQATIIKVDVDENQALAQQYQVRAVPTLMIFKSGALVWQQSGYQPASAIMDALRQFI